MEATVNGVEGRGTIIHVLLPVLVIVCLGDVNFFFWLRRASGSRFFACGCRILSDSVEVAKKSNLFNLLIFIFLRRRWDHSGKSVRHYFLVINS